MLFFFSLFPTQFNSINLITQSIQLERQLNFAVTLTAPDLNMVIKDSIFFYYKSMQLTSKPQLFYYWSDLLCLETCRWYLWYVQFKNYLKLFYRNYDQQHYLLDLSFYNHILIIFMFFIFQKQLFLMLIATLIKEDLNQIVLLDWKYRLSKEFKDRNYRFSILN